MRRNPSVALLLFVCGVAALSAQQPPSADDRAALVRGIDAKREKYASVAKEIWGFAEIGYQETRSSALLQQQLKAAGFQVTAGVAGIPTAFVATFGSGKPVIGIVGEFDALPGLSQEAQTANHHAIEHGGNPGCPPQPRSGSRT
jgi:aminobenzoyl-glutamate utilization protein B